MSEASDQKELGAHQKKDDVEVIVDEKTVKDDESAAIKIKTMREYGCDWGVEDYDYFMSN